MTAIEQALEDSGSATAKWIKNGIAALCVCQQLLCDELLGEHRKVRADGMQGVSHACTNPAV